MVRNICIFSDGTGQAGGKEGRGVSDRKDRSNVARLCEASTAAPSSHQICFYDAGIGSSKDAVARYGWEKYIPWELYRGISQATGLGISMNIIECYAALMARWQPGDKVFLFGFSRGAYTVRSLGGVLKLCGIPSKRKVGDDNDAIAANIELAGEAVKKVYMAAYYESGKGRREAAANLHKQNYGYTECVPHFIGVWDTVRALGTPSTNPIGKFFSSQFEKLFKHQFHDDTLWEKVPFARQALSIDEMREIFAPVVWRTKNGEPVFAAGQSVEQRWFAGVHTDVGGGYVDDDGLSDISLDWMLHEATAAGLIIAPPNRFDGLKRTAYLARQHDETISSIIPYSKKSRATVIGQLPHLGLHPSVKQRMHQPVPKLDNNGGYKTSTYDPDLGGHPV
jgi:uncharacterized protein (DUF2235 family)